MVGSRDYSFPKQRLVGFNSICHCLSNSTSGRLPAQGRLLLPSVVKTRISVMFQCVSGTGTLGSCFESRVVVVCEKMMSRACWAKSKHLIHSKTFRGMTLLHLAAAQGYATLIQTLIKWR